MDLRWMLWFYVLVVLFGLLSANVCRKRKSGVFGGVTEYFSIYFCCRHFVETNKGCQECPIGHIVNEANSDCIPCPEGKYGVKCKETCHCTTNERCDNVAGCVIPAKSTILSPTAEHNGHNFNIEESHYGDQNMSNMGSGGYSIATSSQFTTQPKSKANKIYENLPYIGIIGSLVLVIFILVVFVCVREKRREENDSNNQEKPAQGQKNEMQTHNSVYEYEEIDEQFIQDVLSAEEKFCPNQKFSDESILENDLQSGYLNPYQPVVPEGDKRKYDSLHGVQDNSSGSEGDTRSSGYLHPNLPLSPTLISSDRDYSKLRNRSEQQPVQNKHVLHQVLDLGDDSSINGERDKNEGATDSSSNYLNPYQPIITSKADIHEYKTIHEVEDNSHDYEINI